MRALGVILLAALLAALGACGGSRVTGGTTGSTASTTETGTDTGQTTDTGTTSTEVERCTEADGLITGYLPLAARDLCGPAVRLAVLFRADRLSTGSGGTVEFDTEEITGCKLRPEASVLIHPDETTAVRLLAGAMACDAETGGRRVRLGAPGAEIEITGTLFTLIAADGATVVKVHDGTVRVRSTADPAAGWTELTTSSAGRVPAGEAVQVVSYDLEAWEPELLETLRLGIVTVPPEALAKLTGESAAAGGTVLTETESEGRVLRERKLVQGLPLATVAQLGGERRRQFVRAGNTVVGVGSFQTLSPTFAELRASFGPEVTLVYSPYEFPQTETDTGTTSTETSTGQTDTTTTIP